MACRGGGELTARHGGVSPECPPAASGDVAAHATEQDEVLTVALAYRFAAKIPQMERRFIRKFCSRAVTMVERDLKKKHAAGDLQFQIRFLWLSTGIGDDSNVTLEAASERAEELDAECVVHVDVTCEPRPDATRGQSGDVRVLHVSASVLNDQVLALRIVPELGLAERGCLSCERWEPLDLEQILPGFKCEACRSDGPK